MATAGFGAFVSGLGLYYDDWPSWYLHLTGGPSALVAFAAGQARPLVGLLPALAGSPTGSHLWMAAIHAANAALVLLVLRRVWPGQPSAAALAAALYAVYPNYWIRPTHIALAIDGSLFLALLSLWLGLVAVDGRGARRVALTLVSVLLVPGYLLLYELPLGLELARPLLYALRPGAAGAGRRGRARAALRDGLPWLAVLALFVAWRVLVFRPTGDYARWRWNEIAAPASPVRPRHHLPRRVRGTGGRDVGRPSPGDSVAERAGRRRGGSRRGGRGRGGLPRARPPARGRRAGREAARGRHDGRGPASPSWCWGS